MLKRETLKQAIDAIAARDPEAGYALTELFGTGRIDVSGEAQPASDPNLDYFVFDHLPVPVVKSTYFNEGLAAVEQPLLIQYGQMAQKLALTGAKAGFATARQTIHDAGLKFLVDYEIKLAMDQLKAQTKAEGRNEAQAAGALIEGMSAGAPDEGVPRHPQDPRVLFCGAVNADDPALFSPFPYTREALLQVADLRLPFFSVRFVLRCLRTGTAPQLYACLVNGAVAGLIFLQIKTAFFFNVLEIKYIASAQRHLGPSPMTQPRHRGVGTFLVAGAWLLWKNHLPRVREMALDSEIQASGFYESVGFHKRRPYVYTLVRPAGYLTYALAVMVDRSPAVQPGVIAQLAALVKDQARLLARARPHDPRREPALHFLKLCLLSRTRPDLAHSAAQWLLKYKQQIPEARQLLELGTAHGRITLVERRAGTLHPLLVFKDSVLHSHLNGIFHLESANRLKAMDTVLEDPAIASKWTPVAGRRANQEELGWVHTPAHIARIAATAGKRLLSIDLDTQTTKDSFDNACLAVGGVFSLLDAIQAGPARRGFAVVRPPGHHAEPDKAMGFCLFNNVALGACYLKYTHGARRVMIIDIDAHHGNGTQAAFVQSNEVLFFSLHQFPCYPGTGNFGEVGLGRGEGYSVNVPLDKGMGDAQFALAIDRLAAPLAQAFEPQMILVSCGFDLYQHDRLAGLNGTADGYAMLTRQLCRMADTVCGGRIAFILEGGYSLQGIRECGQSVIRELCGLSTTGPERLEKIIASSAPAFATLQKSMALHARYWPMLRKG